MSNKVESKDKKAMRDKMRTLTVGKPNEFRHRIVEWEGTKFEIREASLLVKNRIELAATKITSRGFIESDHLEIAARHVIEGCYVPGTDERVYDDNDYNDFVAAPDHGFLQALSDAVADLLTVDLEAKKKNSPKTSKGA